ncbi:MAG: MBL fold metallo-hydrolase [Candidatus Aminicenantes bacterium]
MNGLPNLEFKIVYDNHPFTKGLKTGWGFSCLILGPQKTILFDTGADGKTLIHNLNALGFSPADIDTVFLSHIHKDHTGGLDVLLQHKPGLSVWLPDSFPDDFKNTVAQSGGHCHSVTGPEILCPGVHTTGVIEGWIHEQSLFLESLPGIVLITGCAHPRIVRILSEVRRQSGRQIYLVMGGFHLAGFEKSEIRSILSFFEDAGVKKAGPAHCTGDDASKLFKEAFQNHYLDIGAGRSVKIP